MTDIITLFIAVNHNREKVKRNLAEAKIVVTLDSTKPMQIAGAVNLAFEEEHTIGPLYKMLHIQSSSPVTVTITKGADSIDLTCNSYISMDCGALDSVVITNDTEDTVASVKYISN